MPIDTHWNQCKWPHGRPAARDSAQGRGISPLAWLAAVRGVGIAGLIEGILDIAAAGWRMTDDERRAALTHTSTATQEFVVALDALAVYVHKDNPLDHISREELAEIYGQEGQIQRWPLN